MTITDDRPALYVDAADDGGMPARRAVVRWAWRLVQREWRGQALVLALLTLAVAAAIGGSAAVYNLAPAAGDAEFGAASHRLELEHPDPVGLQADLAAAETWFGTVDVISRSFVPVPGLFDPIELRAQEPVSDYGAPMLALLDGRYPTAPGEVALTAGAAEILEVGAAVTFELGGVGWTRVGTVENPSDLHDEFALVPPAYSASPDEVTILVDASDQRFAAFRAPSGSTTGAGRGAANEDILAASGALVASTVVLMLVALLAAAGFVVVARRRLRQLGMLAAIGATERHLRLVMLANGAVVGAAAAVLGAVVGLAAWMLSASSLEAVVGHRIAAFDVPWWLVVSSMLLAVVSAVGAAWWPARAVARTPIVSALSGRPDRPRAASRSVARAGVLVVSGTTCLVLSGDPLESWINVLLILGGTVALIVGVLFVSPLAIRALAGFHAPAPVAVRLALGDLARFQVRSSTALAAITLALGIATTVVVTASSAMYGAASEGNLSDRQLMIRIGEIPNWGDIAPVAERTPAEVDRLDGQVDQIAVGLGATVVPIDVALAPGFDGFEGLPSVVLGEPVEMDEGTAHRVLTHLYVASAALLEHYEIDLADVEQNTEILTVETGELWYQPVEAERVQNAQRLPPGYSSLPGSFITPEALARRGWQTARAGWLVESSTPVTPEQFAEVRETAAAAGVTVEVRHDQANLATMRTVATAVGFLVALGVMAMTVGLIRSEGAGDLRILTAAGATSSNRRTLTAATAGGLALLGAILGTAGAYLGLGAAHIRDLDSLNPVPVLHLLIILVGLPLLATVAGWVLAGREPPWLARQPID